eukprot:10592995-Prorocentrum_lima.AAC.1
MSGPSRHLSGTLMPGNKAGRCQLQSLHRSFCAPSLHMQKWVTEKSVSMEQWAPRTGPSNT